MKTLNFNNILIKRYLTEKLSFISQNNNILAWKVNKHCNKFKIIKAIEIVYNVKINKIRTLIVKKVVKDKKRKKNIIKTWKKAYIYLKKEYNLKINNV